MLLLAKADPKATAEDVGTVLMMAGTCGVGGIFLRCLGGSFGGVGASSWCCTCRTYVEFLSAKFPQKPNRNSSDRTGLGSSRLTARMARNRPACVAEALDSMSFKLDAFKLLIEHGCPLDHANGLGETVPKLQWWGPVAEWPPGSRRAGRAIA